MLTLLVWLPPTADAALQQSAAAHQRSIARCAKASEGKRQAPSRLRVIVRVARARSARPVEAIC
jgi:hypothetical protein